MPKVRRQRKPANKKDIPIRWIVGHGLPLRRETQILRDFKPVRRELGMVEVKAADLPWSSAEDEAWSVDRSLDVEDGRITVDFHGLSTDLVDVALTGGTDIEAYRGAEHTRYSVHSRTSGGLLSLKLEHPELRFIVGKGRRSRGGVAIIGPHLLWLLEAALARGTVSEVHPNDGHIDVVLAGVATQATSFEAKRVMQLMALLGAYGVQIRRTVERRSKEGTSIRLDQVSHRRVVWTRRIEGLDKSEVDARCFDELVATFDRGRKIHRLR